MLTLIFLNALMNKHCFLIDFFLCLFLGECLVTGQSHYKTFDNKFFTFSGICQYLLAKDCQSNSFSAIIETAQVWNLLCRIYTCAYLFGCVLMVVFFLFKCADDQDAICTRSVTLRFRDLANQTVHLKHGGVVSVDGMDVKTPLINGLSSSKMHTMHAQNI